MRDGGRPWRRRGRSATNLIERSREGRSRRNGQQQTSCPEESTGITLHHHVDYCLVDTSIALNVERKRVVVCDRMLFLPIAVGTY